MNLKAFQTVLFVFALSLLVVSCSKKSNTQGKNIPANAAVVVIVNGATISAKLPWGEVKQNEMYQILAMDSTMSSIAKSALDNPDNTGIDSKKDLIFFMVKDSSGAYVGATGTLKDETTFKAYNTATLTKGIAAEKDGVQFITDRTTSVSWTKEKFIIVFDAPQISEANQFNTMMMDDTSTTQVNNNLRNVEAVAASLYQLEEKKSLAKNEKFSELMGSKADIHFWMNTEALYESDASLSDLSMLNISKLYKDSYSTATVNFENGQINIDSKIYSSKEMSDIFKKYSGANINKDIIQRLPAKDVAVLFAMNYKPEGLKKFIELTGLEGLINIGASQLGFNVDDFIKSHNGELLLAVTDIKIDSMFGTPNPNVLFSSGVGDKTSFDKIVNAAQKEGAQMAGASPNSIHFSSNGKMFALGNQKAMVDDFVSKDAKSNFAFLDKIAGGPIGGYFNLQYILTSLKPSVSGDSSTIIMIDASLKMWDNILISGGQFKDGSLQQHVEINLMDKNTNSLKQLNNYLGTLVKLAKENESKLVWDQENFSPDSIVISTEAAFE
ncbi:MAG: DUF4836 family protein [Ferruginibacter sp.]